MEIKYDYSIWMNHIIKLQQLMIDVSNTQAIDFSLSNSGDFRSFVMNLKPKDIYSNVKYSKIPKMDEIMEVSFNDFVGNNNNINIGTMKGLMKLTSFILIFFTDEDNVDSGIIPSKDNLYTISLGNNILFDSLTCVDIVNKFTVPIIEYLQSIKYKPIYNDYAIPDIDFIPYLEGVYKYKDEVNKLFNEVPDLNNLIESVPNNIKYIVMTGINFNEEEGGDTEYTDDDYNILSIKMIVDKINKVKGITSFVELEDERDNLSSIKYLLKFLKELLEIKEIFLDEDDILNISSIENFIDNGEISNGEEIPQDSDKYKITINYANRLLSVDEIASSSQTCINDEEAKELIDEYDNNKSYDMNFYNKLFYAYLMMMNKYTSFRTKGVNITNISEALMFLNGEEFGVLPNNEIVKYNTDTDKYYYYYYESMIQVIDNKMTDLTTKERNNK